MDHAEYKRAVLAEPHNSSAQVLQHRESCPECAQFTKRLLSFEARLEAALAIDTSGLRNVRVGGATVTRLDVRRPARLRRGWLALAASLTIGLILAGGLWLAIPGYSLAADVVTHMAEEPQAWRRTEIPVPDSSLSAVLRDSHLTLRPGAGVVSYANSCEFRGHRVPHLVVQSDSGPVTVMVLVHEEMHRTVHFDEQGYRGVIVPVAGHGSLAVLGRGPTSDPKAVERTAARVLASIEWTP